MMAIHTFAFLALAAASVTEAVPALLTLAVVGAQAPGSENSGSENSGSENSGSENSGSENSGSENSGSENSGSKNSESSEREGMAIVNPRTADVSQAFARVLGTLIVGEAARADHFAIVTQEDIEGMLDFESTRATLDCDAELSCLAEIGSALGVPLLLSSSVGRVGSTFVLSLTLVDIENASVKSRATKIANSEEELLQSVPFAVNELLRPLIGKGSGALAILVAQRGATIEIDGRAVGTSPQREERVPAGMHRVRVYKAGHVAYEKDIEVGEDETREVKILLGVVEEGTGISGGDLAIWSCSAAWCLGFSYGGLMLLGSAALIEVANLSSPKTGPRLGLEDAYAPVLTTAGCGLLGLATAANPIWWTGEDLEEAYDVEPAGEGWEVTGEQAY